MIITPPQTNFIKDTYCSWCGVQFTEQVIWPRKCFRCGNDSYKNPIPIIVSLIRVDVDGKSGVLIQKRNIEPKKGEWALPGGYIEHGETWQKAAARENFEEMNLMSWDTEYFLWDIQTALFSGNMLIFCGWDRRISSKDFITNFIPNSEVTELGIYYGSNYELAFPLHKELSDNFLDSMNRL